MARAPSVCIFCGSRIGTLPAHKAAATEAGREIANRGWRLVYGGGGIGLMSVAADAALEAGGNVIGVIPEFLRAREAGHDGLDDLIVTDGMHDRKQIMFDLADAFLVLPGGVGTMDELVEILTWKQLGRHSKPILLVDLGGFWKPMLAAFDNAVAHDFMGQGTIDLLEVVPDMPAAMALLDREIA